MEKPFTPKYDENGRIKLRNTYQSFTDIR